MYIYEIFLLFLTLTEMESFYTEVKHYVLSGGYHNLTIAAEKPDTRKALIRRASKKYLIKGK